MDESLGLTPSEMLKNFMGSKEMQSDSCFDQRESISSSSRGSMRSISSISSTSDDLSGKNELCFKATV